VGKLIPYQVIDVALRITPFQDPEIFVTFFQVNWFLS